MPTGSCKSYHWYRAKDPILIGGPSSWGTESGSGFKDVKWHTIWDFFVPAYTCPWDNQRVGKFGDGGKWICGMSKYMEEKERTLVVYSFGVKDDSSFEEEMLSRTNAKIVAVDFSVDSVCLPTLHRILPAPKTDAGVLVR